MKADELLMSAEELPWRSPISACGLRLNGWLGDLALVQNYHYRDLRNGMVSNRRYMRF
jgi:hypothetical protein